MTTPPADGDARARARAEELVGRTLDGRYRIESVIAMGGMGAVYLGRHIKLKKRVALKVLHPDVEDQPELLQRFEREALAGAHVAHPHVACATDFGELPDGTRYLVMEHVRGQTLRAVLDRDGALPPPRAARIARQIAVALGAIHARGVVHRDLKPRNVMLTADDFVKVVDFGLAKIEAGRVSTLSEEEERDDARLTAGGVVFGTFGHLAPEAALGMEAVDARADLYALGVMFYEMIAGKHPFEAKSDLQLFAQQRSRPAPPFAERVPGLEVEPELEQVVLRLLERQPGDRPGSAAEVVAAIDAAEPSASDAPPPPPESLVLSMRPGPVDEVEEAVRKVWAPLLDPPPRTPRREGRAGPDEAPPDARLREGVFQLPASGGRSRRLALVGGAVLLAVVGAVAAATCGARPTPPGASPATSPGAAPPPAQR